MVQVTFDTKNDSLEELEEALRVLHDAIARKRGAPATPVAVPPVPAVPDAETTIDTPFLSISIKDADATAPAEEPTLNQLLSESSLTEEEMSTMFKQVEATDPPKKKPKKESSDAQFIEIVEFDEEEEKN